MPEILNQHSIKHEIKNNLVIGIPLIAAQLIYSCSGFIGTAFVARLGKDALAASVLVTMIWFSLSVFFFGILNAVSVLVSHQYGAKNDNAISDIMGQAYLLGILICIPMILLLYGTPWFLPWSQQPPEVLHLAKDYLFAMIWTIPGLNALIISEQFLAGIGRAKIVLRVSLLIVPIEIPLIYAMVFGRWGSPAFGVAGVGYGFATTYTLSALGLLLYLYTSKQYERFHIFKRIFRINGFYLRDFLRVGLPIGFMQMLEVSAFAVATMWIARFGTTVLAAHQIVMQYSSFAITVVFAMAQVITIRVGHAVGQEDSVGIRYAIYVGMLLNTIFVSLIMVAFFLAPTFFIRLDLDIYDPNNISLIRNASLLLGLSGILLLFDNFRICGFGALRALKDTRFAMYTSLLGFWFIGLSIAYFLSFNLHYSARGIWTGLILGIGSSAIAIHLRLRYILPRLDLRKLLSTEPKTTI